MVKAFSNLRHEDFMLSMLKCVHETFLASFTFQDFFNGTSAFEGSLAGGIAELPSVSEPTYLDLFTVTMSGATAQFAPTDAIQKPGATVVSYPWISGEHDAVGSRSHLRS